MKNRLYTFLIVTMLLTLLGSSAYALSATINTLNNLSLEAVPFSELCDDTAIRFLDPNFEEAVRDLIDKPTGDVMASDVDRITCLELENINIVDLTGIEYFTALEILYCGSNQLTALDISHNIALKELECSYNSLTILDVSQNVALTKLVCSGNELTELDVTHNPLLEELTCWINELKILDVSHNPVLKWLSCSENRLMMLDVSCNPVLESLSCSRNQLTMLDVSYNPALVAFFCRNNRFADKSAIIGLDETQFVEFVFEPQGEYVIPSSRP